MHPDELITHLRAALGLDDLEFNSVNVCRLLVDDDIEIDLEFVAEDDALYCYSVVGTTFDENQKRDWAEVLLAANLFGRETAGASFALDEETDDILLCRVFDMVDLSADRFLRQLEEFSNVSSYWSGRLSEAGDSEEFGEMNFQNAPNIIRA